jgi:hypothetical protein
VCLLAWAASAAELAPVLRGIENRYNRAQTLEVNFEQTYRGQGRAWKPERGRLWLRKPGKMRWEYSEPEGKLFVTDGKFAWLYTPASNEVERTRLKETEDLRAPLAFLLGRLDFARDFQRFIWRREGKTTGWWPSRNPTAWFTRRWSSAWTPACASGKFASRDRIAQSWSSASRANASTRLCRTRCSSSSRPPARV